MSRKIVLFVLIAIYLSGCAASPEVTLPPDTPTPEPIPMDTATPEPIPTDTPIPEPTPFDGIIVEFENLFPERIEYDENGERFLLASFSKRTVIEVFDDGRIEPFIEDPDLDECHGLEIDRKNQRLLVVHINDAEGISYLNAYDLASGERIFMSDISSIMPDLPYHAEDVAVDPDGFAYVTARGPWWSDDVPPVIFRVDMEGNSTVFMEDPLFNNLHGIVYHSSGYLLLGSYPGLLLKIPIDNPEVTRVEITEGDWGFEDINGMIMHPDGTLIMVAFPDSIIGRLQSDDDWETARVVGRSLGHDAGYGTSVALRGEEVHVIYSHWDAYGMGIGKQDTYEIVPVIFE